MKTAIVVAVMLAAGRAAALDEWTAADTALEAGFAAAVLVDVRQTHWALHNGYEERNPLLPRSPRDAHLGGIAAAAIVTHGLISLALPARWRRVWQAASLTGELAAVGWNFSVGVRLEI